MAYTLTPKDGIQIVLNGPNLDISVNASQIATPLLNALKTVDGAGSGLDADVLDGQQGTHYLARVNHTGTQLASTISDFTAAADARIDTKVPQIVTANFVNQLNVNADTVGLLTSTQLLARANHTGTQAVSTLSDYATATDSRIDARVTKTFVDNLSVNAGTLGTFAGSHYLARANHSGTQTAATISDFATQVNSGIDTRVNKAFVDALGVNASTVGTRDSAYLLSRTNHTGTQVGTTVTYDNTGHDLLATNVQSAIDELDFKKADIASLSSNIILYSTTAAANVSPYNKLVTSTDDPDYDDVAVNVSTGQVTGQNQLVAGFISAPGVIVGNPGIVSITTVGSIRRTAGGDGANFYFTISKRDSAGNEVILGTSGNTPVVTEGTYKQFAEYALLNNGLFVDTDRIVIKYFANRVGNTTAPTFDIQVGGSDPVRTLLPVPISVIPAENASGIIVATASFNKILSGADDSVQKALNTLDDHTHLAADVTDFSTATGTVVTKSFVEGLNVELAALKATGATANHVLTANGTGAASWQSALANVALEDLQDVNYSFGPPVQGDQLIYNETTGTWQPQTPLGGGDMLKSTYDQDLDGIVDKAEALNDGSVSATAQEVRNFIDSDPFKQATYLMIALN
jgi:hypothetical protein